MSLRLEFLLFGRGRVISFLLPKYFVQKYNEEFHKNVQKISKGVEDFFMNYNWPGNVRELKNVVERAMILVDEDTLLMEHLPDRDPWTGLQDRESH